MYNVYIRVYGWTFEDFTSIIGSMNKKGVKFTVPQFLSSNEKARLTECLDNDKDYELSWEGRGGSCHIRVSKKAQP